MSLLVNGSTRVLGVVGDPIAQVRAPGVWTALFQRNDVNAVCVPMHVRSSDIVPFFKGIRTLANLQGLIATIPHKPAMLQLVDEATPRSRQVGAVNVVAIWEDGRTSGDILDRGLHAPRPRGDRRRRGNPSGAHTTADYCP